MTLKQKLIRHRKLRSELALLDREISQEAITYWTNKGYTCFPRREALEREIFA